jgi:hypothetical protein
MLTLPSILPEIKALSSKKLMVVIAAGCFSKKCFSIPRTRSMIMIAPSTSPTARFWKSSSQLWNTAFVI